MTNRVTRPPEHQFDLVCEREWLRSFLSSSALAGELRAALDVGSCNGKCAAETTDDD